METAGKEIEDDALRQAMKDCGIGTPATRASIIETLFKRGYMERCKKSLVPTEKGLALNSVVKTMRIADVAMTGEWEKELARIERGELSDDTFRKEIEAYTREITSELISCDKLFGSRDSGCACPKCGTGRMRFYGKVVRTIRNTGWISMPPNVSSRVCRPQMCFPHCRAIIPDNMFPTLTGSPSSTM